MGFLKIFLILFGIVIIILSIIYIDQVQKRRAEKDFQDQLASPDYDSTRRLGRVLCVLIGCFIIGIVINRSIGDSPSSKSDGFSSANQTVSESSHSSSSGHSVSTPVNSYHSTNHSATDRSDDDEYWNSVARQKALEEMGYDGAANMEKNARLEYMQGGGYHAADGTPQVHFQGSREQAEQLKQMDELGW